MRQAPMPCSGSHSTVRSDNDHKTAFPHCDGKTTDFHPDVRLFLISLILPFCSSSFPLFLILIFLPFCYSSFALFWLQRLSFPQLFLVHSCSVLGHFLFQQLFPTNPSFLPATPPTRRISLPATPSQFSPKIPSNSPSLTTHSPHRQLPPASTCSPRRRRTPLAGRLRDDVPGVRR